MLLRAAKKINLQYCRLPLGITTLIFGARKKQVV
jgi:hypothetical protein